MAQKTITLILLGADRKLWDGDSVRLQVTQVNSPLKVLFNKKLAAGTHTVRLDLDLFFDSGQVYGISVDAKKHRSAWQLINRRTFLRQQGAIEVESKEHILQLMLVPNKPSSSDLDAGYDKLRDLGSPVTADNTGIARQAYLDFKPAAKMAMLNLEAKLRETRLGDASLLSFVEAVRFVDVDRIFLFMRSDVKHLIEGSSEFASAPGHEAPTGTLVALPAHSDSWKHRRFGAGNIQVSFSDKAEPLPGDTGKQVFSADVDIDLEQDLGHVFEWLDNHFIHPDQKTDQTLVYALLFSQGILPVYTLDPLPEA